MPFNIHLAERIRKYLFQFPKLSVVEKKMFGGLAFMVNGKMCVNVSGENLMCRFDPACSTDIELRKGYLPMIMKGKEYKGYCYVEPHGFEKKVDFDFWMKMCLAFNKTAKASAKRKEN